MPYREPKGSAGFAGEIAPWIGERSIVAQGAKREREQGEVHLGWGRQRSAQKVDS